MVLGVGQRRLCVEWVSKLRPEDEKNISHVETAGKSTLSRRNNKHKGFEARTNLQLRGTERRWLVRLEGAKHGSGIHKELGEQAKVGLHGACRPWSEIWILFWWSSDSFKRIWIWDSWLCSPPWWVTQTFCVSAFAFFHRIEELQHYELPRSSWIVTVSYTDLYIHLRLGKNVNSLWQAPASITEKTPGCRLEVPMFITGQEIFAYKAMHPGLSLTPSKRLVLTSTPARDNILENFYLHTNISSPPPNLSLLST